MTFFNTSGTKNNKWSKENQSEDLSLNGHKHFNKNSLILTQTQTANRKHTHTLFLCMCTKALMNLCIFLASFRHPRQYFSSQVR